MIDSIFCSSCEQNIAREDNTRFTMLWGRILCKPCFKVEKKKLDVITEALQKKAFISKGEELEP